MTDRYDVVVLGAGPAGEHCAGQLADAGLHVAVVERELVGGECSYWACIPSKTLLRPGEALAAARNAPGARERVDGQVDPRAAFDWRDFMVSDHHDDGQVEWLGREGIDLYRGDGALEGPGAVAVAGTTLTTRHVVVATGSDPMLPPIPGLRDLDGVWTNREVTATSAVPPRLVVLGGGPVGVEMAQAMARMGSSVTLVEGQQHVLPREPPALGGALGDALAADGIDLRLGRHASSVGRAGEEYVVAFDGGDELRADRLLVATGRRPRVGGIGLESVGIEPRERGIAVDARMRAADGVWAIGDVTGVWPLTYVGKYQGRVAASNILGRPREARYEAVPRVVFTDPQAASVGDGEGAHTVTIGLGEVARTATYTRAYEDAGFLTLVSDGERLTGAYALGPEAAEWLGQATLAISARVPLRLLHDTIQPFPTFSEAYLHALLALEQRAAAQR